MAMPFFLWEAETALVKYLKGGGPPFAVHPSQTSGMKAGRVWPKDGLRILYTALGRLV